MQNQMMHGNMHPMMQQPGGMYQDNNMQNHNFHHQHPQPMPPAPPVNGSHIPFNNAVPNNFPPAPQAPPPGAIVPNAPPPGTIPLSVLLDYVVHKTYHDITVMADLLPSKTDLDKKITIVQFATRTRQLFIRILALVKWASSVGKVVRCSDISSFLDRQAMLFVDTADKLHVMANQLVVQARLPNFSIPAAVDILTTGSYPRLPSCIRDRIIAPDPILPLEKRATLKRIEQIVLYRLAVEEIPVQIADLRVERGVVHLYVPGEFNAALTLMGDSSDVPWRLLKLEFLVEDLEVGSGRCLVHSLQVNYVHELIQSRLFANDRPLVDLYDLLHSFCLSLQLEVLHSQANRFLKMRWGKFIHVDEYVAGKKLTLSYWKLSPYKSDRTAMTLTVQLSQGDLPKPLQVVHNPELPLDDISLVERASHISHLSLERLIHQSIAIRSLHVLCQLKEMLHKHIRHESSRFGNTDSSRSSVLVIPLIEPGGDDDSLRVHVDPQTGTYTPIFPGLDQSVVNKMEKEMNECSKSLLSWIPRLQKEVVQLRCTRSLQHLNVQVTDHLVLANQHDHPIGKLDQSRCVHIKMLNFPSYYVVMEMLPDAERPIAVKFNYHLLRTAATPTGAELQLRSSTGAAQLKTLGTGERRGKGEVVARSFVQLRVAAAAALSRNYGAGGDERMELDDEEEDGDDDEEEDSLRELVFVASLCEYRIPFIHLVERFREEGVEEIGVRDEGRNLMCWINWLPASGDDPDAAFLLASALLQCSFRLQCRNINKMWSAELILQPPPFPVDKRPQPDSIRLHLTYECQSMREKQAHGGGKPDAVRLFLDDWSAITHLYRPVRLFAEQLKHPACPLRQTARVHDYTYKAITLKYGPGLAYHVAVAWQASGKRYVLQFGRAGDLAANSNPHWMSRHYLTEQFNSDQDLARLLHTLNDTLPPLLAISRLPTTPVLGVSGKSFLAEQVFAVTAQTATHFRIAFLSVYSLDVFCRSDGAVALRDAAFSQFDYGKVKTSTIPIPHLGAFLAKFRDQQRDLRHRADQLRDNPPSPVLQQLGAGAANLYGLQDIPQQAWAGAAVTVVSHQSLAILCAGLAQMQPAPAPRKASTHGFAPSPLEQFLGACATRRHLDKCVKQLDNVTEIQLPAELLTGAGADSLGQSGTAFACQQSHSLQFHCALHKQTMRQLVLRVIRNPQQQAGGAGGENWSAEDAKVIERYFDSRVVTAPYRFNVVKSFFTIISAPAHHLRDFVQLMRIEMMGLGRPTKWSMHLCLTVPPRLTIAPVGMPSNLVKDKVLVFVQLTQNPTTQQQQGNMAPVIDIPLLLQPPNSMVSVLGQALTNTRTGQNLHQVQNLLQQIGQMRAQMNPNEGVYTFAVRYLMESLVLPG